VAQREAARVVCPCGGVPAGASYDLCCRRYHTGTQHLQAPTPEALMRSRYSAYAMGLVDYINATWHSSTRPEALSRFEAADKWLGLQIKDAPSAIRGEGLIESGYKKCNEGFVEFVARSKPKGGGAAIRLHERSRFVCEDGRWFYVDGVML
jgi:SEC-C motif domain protein